MRRWMMSLISGDDDARDAEADVLIEAVVFGREDGLFEEGRDAFVGDDLAPLDRELADDFAARAVDARDRARRVVVEGGDPGEVAGVGEDDPGRDSQPCRQHEERDDDQPAGETYKAHGADSDPINASSTSSIHREDAEC